MLISAAGCIITILLAGRALNSLEGFWGFNRLPSADAFQLYQYSLLACLVLCLGAFAIFAVYLYQMRMHYVQLGIPFNTTAAKFRLYLILPILNLFIPPVPILEMIDHQGSIISRSRTVPDESYPQPRGVRIGFLLFILLLTGTAIYALIQSPVLRAPNMMKWLLQNEVVEGEVYHAYMNLILASLAFLMGALLVHWIGRLDRALRRMQDAGELVTEYTGEKAMLRIVDNAEAYEQERQQRLDGLRGEAASDDSEQDFF